MTVRERSGANPDTPPKASSQTASSARHQAHQPHSGAAQMHTQRARGELTASTSRGRSTGPCLTAPSRSRLGLRRIEHGPWLGARPPDHAFVSKGGYCYIHHVGCLNLHDELLRGSQQCQPWTPRFFHSPSRSGPARTLTRRQRPLAPDFVLAGHQPSAHPTTSDSGTANT